MHFSQTIIERSENPLEFWNLNKLCFPKLAEAARIVLAIPATAAPSERVWSDAGNIVTRQTESFTNEFSDASFFEGEFDHSFAPNFIAFTELN